MPAAFSYDNAGRVLSERFSDGAPIQYEYDAVGNVIKETNPKGAVTLKTYDANGNLVKESMLYEGELIPVTTYIYKAVEVSANRAQYLLEQQKYLTSIT